MSKINIRKGKASEVTTKENELFLSTDTNSIFIDGNEVSPTGKESADNKVTTLDDSTSHYPSCSAVKDYVDDATSNVALEVSMEDTTLTGDVTGSGTSSITTTLANSGVTAGSYGPSADATPGYGSTFNVPYITVDAKGRVTSASTKTVKIPASDNDEKVRQDVSTTELWRNVLLGDTTNSSSTTSATLVTGGYSYLTTGFSFQPSTGTLKVNKVDGVAARAQKLDRIGYWETGNDSTAGYRLICSIDISNINNGDDYPITLLIDHYKFDSSTSDEYFVRAHIRYYSTYSLKKIDRLNLTNSNVTDLHYVFDTTNKKLNLYTNIITTYHRVIVYVLNNPYAMTVTMGSASVVSDITPTKINNIYNKYYPGAISLTDSGKPVGRGTTVPSAIVYDNGLVMNNPATVNDGGLIRVTGTGESDTVLELATYDDGGTGEQIKCSQYTTSGTVNHQITLMNTSGNQTFNNVTRATGYNSGHTYLTGATSSSVSNTSQIVFGTSDSQKVAISSADSNIVINPSTSTTTNQIVLCTGSSQNPSIKLGHSGSRGIMEYNSTTEAMEFRFDE